MISQGEKDWDFSTGFPGRHFLDESDGLANARIGAGFEQDRIGFDQGAHNTNKEPVRNQLIKGTGLQQGWAEIRQYKAVRATGHASQEDGLFYDFGNRVLLPVRKHEVRRNGLKGVRQ